MSLTPGDRLGAYDVLARLGAGGMGEVFRGRDRALHRDVALKVLPEAFVQDTDRIARFGREAQILAALNHPNIAAIYGVESSGAVPALVLELVEGPTLADRIASGTLPVDEALAVAAQVVAALEAAHSQGIVHRDLKPANIKLRPDGTVKVLDFGLAKALDGNAVTANPDLSQAITSPALTRAGLILGTAAYMSPEQARGRSADARSDIWAFGVVLYEMLTGERMFQGDDVADTLAAVLRAEPSWTAMPADAPASIRRLLRRCLQKDPQQRLQHIGDARLELADAENEATAAVAPAPRRLWPLGAAAAAGAAVAAALTAALGGARTMPPPERPVTRFSMQAPNLAARVIGSGSSVVISPDGRTVVYVIGGSGLGLERRRLNELSGEPIRGTEGGSRPFFSPDGQSIGFFTSSQLKRVSIDGGTPVVVADAPPNARGTWGDDDTIVIARPGLSRVPAGGGVVQQVLEANEDAGQFYEAEFLPGARAVLVQNRRPPSAGSIEAVELATGVRHRLVEGSSPKLAATGELLFVRDGKIWAAEFDTTRLSVAGTPVPLVESESLGNGDAGEGGFATSGDGTLVYLAGEAASSLVWLDRQGAATPAWPGLVQVRNPRLSPDGRRLVANGTRAADLWLFDLERGSRLRLTTEGFNRGGAWSPDGQRFAFFSAPSTPQLGAGLTQDLFSIPAGGGAPTKLLDRPGPQWADSWSPDGRYLVFDDGPGYSRDLWVLPLGGEPRPLVASRFNERGGAISRDGTSMAFVSDESGRDEVYVQPFPDPGSKVPISTNGGRQPVWSRDGSLLFYREGEWLMTVAVQTNPFRAASPRRVFEMPTALYSLDPYVADYDVAADGRILTVRREGAAEIHVVLNWVEELRRALAGSSP
jgi:eukaryotic-like serine/threonine-protein kinase